MTPRKAIKLRCKNCQPENKADDICKDCQLKDQSLSNLKKIKHYCKNFCCNRYNPADYCDDTDCSLFIYRIGHNPSRAGMGGNISSVVKKRTVS